MKLNWFGLLHVILGKSHAFVCRVDGKDLLSLVYGHLIGCFACQLQSCKSTIAIWTMGIQESSKDPRFRSTVIGVEAKKLEVFPTVFSGESFQTPAASHIVSENLWAPVLMFIWNGGKDQHDLTFMPSTCLHPVPKTRGAHQSETPKHDSVLMPTLAYAATHKQTLIRILDPIISHSGSSAWGSSVIHLT